MQNTFLLALYIVVADDDADDHLLIKQAFQECNKNHIVTSVYNGRQLLDLLEQKGFYKHDYKELPDLIILDLKMPLMTGFEALEKIKQSDRLKGIPVVVLSESNMKESVEKAKELGAEDFFTKPLNYKDLRDLMLEVCRRVGARSGNV